MIEIIPAILPPDFKDLQEKMSFVKGLVPIVQIDVTDGKFTPKASWPYLGHLEDPNFVSIKKEEKEFPFWDGLDFEVDLMVKNPENVWFDWVMVGAKRIVFHYESSEDIGGLLKSVRSKLIPKESVLYVEIGLAINIVTPNKEIYDLLEYLDFVQFMGIDKIGFQNQPFNEEVIEKIKDLRRHDNEILISVDGGVNLENAPALIEAGAKRLVSGSTIFDNESAEDMIDQFQNLN